MRFVTIYGFVQSNIQHVSPVSGGFAPRSPPGLCPWTPLGDFRPQTSSFIPLPNSWLRPCFVTLAAFHHLTVTNTSTKLRPYATPLFPYLELIYAHWYTRAYQSLTAVVFAITAWSTSPFFMQWSTSSYQYLTATPC